MHPDRGDLHDLVLVRRAELACRNSWDRDLWEPSGRPVADGGGPGGSIEIPRPGTVPDNPTDRVTSISISKLKQSAVERPRHPAVTGGQGTNSTTVESSLETPTVGRQISRKHHVSSLEPAFTMALRGGGSQVNDRGGTEPTDRRTTVVRTSSTRSPEPPAPRMSESFQRRSHPPKKFEATSPLPIEELNRLVQPSPARPAASAPVSEPVAATQDGNAAPLVHIDGLEREAGPERNAFTASLNTPDESLPNRSPLDVIPWIAGIPRCCDTCRDYRRAPEGAGGYCGNPDAFVDQTVVQSQELACRSSIGVFWLPSDELWLDQADISHHTRPTPYLDEILADVRPDS